LPDFWNSPPRVDKQRVTHAHHWLRHYNQANGSIWTALPGAGPTGLRWPAGLRFTAPTAALPVHQPDAEDSAERGPPVGAPESSGVISSGELGKLVS
jgi:hypothetical protein